MIVAGRHRLLPLRFACCCLCSMLQLKVGLGASCLAQAGKETQVQMVTTSTSRLRSQRSSMQLCHTCPDLSLRAESARCGLSLTDGMDVVNAFGHEPGLTSAWNMTGQPHCAAPHAISFV